MAEMPSAHGGHDKNYPVHANDYAGFLSLFKWGTLVVAIIAATVIYVISN